jgi:3'(2'), 5'-bisphosphate nucleotidase
MYALATLLPEILALSHRAGEAILKVYQSDDFSVERKGDDSPLTAADLAAHGVIMQGLQALTPELPRLSEEGSTIPYAERRAWQEYWLVDPLDGTKEFVKRNGEFTVNIALIRAGIPVLGVVHAPALGVSYYAAAGCGASKQVAGQPAQPIRTRGRAEPPKLVVSRSHVTPELEAVLARMPAHDAVNIGSSLKFCLVAEGSADFYPRVGLTSEWDTAAGQCVVEQAGGAVLTLDGRQLAYNGKESLLNPYFMVIGDRAYPWGQYLQG